MNSDHNPRDAEYFRIEGPVSQRMIEFKSFKFPVDAAGAIGLPADPGTMRRDGSGQAMILHVAPGCFLAPEPMPDIVRLLDALQSVDVGVRFQVDGKWQAFTLTGWGAARVLSSAINLSQVLANRDCTSIYLYDCPAVLAVRSDSFDVWVEASYAWAFHERASHLAQSLAAAPGISFLRA